MTPPARSTVVAATSLPRGARGLVAAVEGDEGTVGRLAALGLVPGTAFEVLQGGSPMAIAVGGTRLALGRPWARALQVVPL